MLSLLPPELPVDERAWCFKTGQMFAEEHGLPHLVSSSIAEAVQSHQDLHRLVLLVHDKGLGLQRLVRNPPHSAMVDFVSQSWFPQNRGSRNLSHTNVHGGHELLLKACGVKKDQALFVFDATPGLGRDAFLLARAGCHVFLSERNPVLASMLSNGIDRAKLANSGMLWTTFFSAFPPLLLDIDLFDCCQRSLIECRLKRGIRQSC